jgi:hypothetical protein
MITDEQVEAALSATDFCINAATMKWMRAALEASERAAWRPIEEADKSSKILVWSPIYGGQHKFAKWDDNRHAAKPKPYWAMSDDRIDGIGAQRANQPTHFRPLPTPPHEG